MRRAAKFLLHLPRRLLVLPVKAYRKYVSPAKGTPVCRFVPTCSEYALIALERWGAVIGILLILWRVLRCNPFCKGGFDPVPERKVKKGRQN